MVITKQFEYTPLERITFADGSRFYACPRSGRRLPSVTTILSQTADKTELLAWIQRIGEEKAAQIRREATNLGSLMHKHLECHLDGIPRPGGSNLVRRMASDMADVIIDKGLVYIDDVYGYEVPLYYPELYAGTTDLVARYKGRMAIVDFKTTKSIDKKYALPDYFCQLGAYALAHNELFGTDITRGVLFVVSRDMQFQEYMIEGDAFEACTLQWAERLDRYAS